MDFDTIRTYSFQRSLDYLLTIMIICILISFAASAYTHAYKMFRTISALGDTYTTARLDILHYLYIKGEWPKNNKQASEIGWNSNYISRAPHIVRRTIIRNGAINLVFGEVLPGKVITFRPATPMRDLSGPVFWSCSPSIENTKWVLHGIDHTSIETRYIHRTLR